MRKNHQLHHQVPDYTNRYYRVSHKFTSLFGFCQLVGNNFWSFYQLKPTKAGCKLWDTLYFEFAAIIIYPISTIQGDGYKQGQDKSKEQCRNKTGVQFIQCFEEMTFSVKEIVQAAIKGHNNDDDEYVESYLNVYEDDEDDSKGIRVNNFFDDYGGLVKSVDLNNDTLISHSEWLTIELQLNSNLSYEIYFMDKKLQHVFGSPDIIPRPVITLKPNAGEVNIYLKAIRHEKLNQPHKPCDPSPYYDFTICLEKSIITRAGCQPPWRRFIMEGEPLCDNLTLLNKFAKKSFEFYSPDENKLFETSLKSLRLRKLLD